MLIIHESPQEIIDAYDGDSYSDRSAGAQIAKVGCWGFIDEDGNVNIYYTRFAQPEDIMELLAHEMTHKRYEAVIRARGEEAVCCAVAAVCTDAYRHLQRIGRV